MDQVPLLEIDGLHLVQQSAILRYLGRKFDMYGSTLADAAQIDILSDCIQDWNPIISINRGDASKHERYLARLQRALKSNGGGRCFLVGSKASWCDVQLFQALQQLTTTKGVDLANKYPLLEEYRLRVAALPGIAEYLASGRQPPFPGAGGEKAYFEKVQRAMPWVFGKAPRPEMACDEWHFAGSN